MRLQVHHVRQSGPFSSIVKYDAEVEVTPGERRVAVDVLSTLPDDAGPMLVAEAAEAIQRGAESVLNPRGCGAIIRVRGLCIHDVDFAPQHFERYTATELLRAWGRPPDLALQRTPITGRASCRGTWRMDAGSIIARWKERLAALADNPEYVFRNTPQHLIEQHYRRLTTFVGYPESEVAEAEARLGVRFPTVFRQYLLEMGKSPGDLFRGSDLAGLPGLERFRDKALELLTETDPARTLPPEAVVFLSHQGYTFVYMIAIGGFDAPPMQWTEMEREPRQVAVTFADMVDAELRLMESVNRSSRERGGYYLTLHPDGGVTESHPAPASGEHALDQARRGRGDVDPED